MMGAIEQRLQFLECEFRRSRRVNRFLAFAVVAIVCIAGTQTTSHSASKPKTSKIVPPPGANLPEDRVLPDRDRLRTVEADQFVLLDRLGRERAKMVMTNSGPAISMFDEKGRKRLELSHPPAASGLRLFDSSELPVVSLQLPKDADRAYLEITSPQGSSLTKASGFSVQDIANKGRLILALINGNFPVLGIGQDGQSGPHSVEITPQRLAMHNNDGYPLFSVSVAKNGATHLNMQHPDHERSLQISSNPKDLDGPVMAFFAPANKDDDSGLLPFLRFGLHQDQDRQPYIRIVDGGGNALFTAPAKLPQSVK